MYPELFTLNLPVIGELTITSFGLLMAMAFLTGYMVLRSETTRLEQDPDLAADILLGALIGGIVGAKLYYVFLYWDRTAADPFGMLFSRGGLVWYGGFIGGFIGVVWALRRRGVPIGLGADAVAPALAISYAVGRVGCFLVGDDYGRPTESWVGIAFPNGQPPSTAANLRRFGAEVDPAVPDTEVLAVHPTQLYETGLSLLFFFLLWRLRRHPHEQGWLFGVWLVLAGAERLFVEVFRAKDDRFLGSFTLAQAISIVVIIVGLALFLRLRRPAEAPAT
ncbi:MAG: prolipoprotein diacylglyceryl transferase [Gemmatimonadetes bacterium]|nr:prolipoprotein diacylglyceryl transferase [Gemmatimonadota bacterium]